MYICVYIPTAIKHNKKGSKTMPKIVAVINSKGGTGKTTTVTNIAYHLHQAGESVLLVDIDPQGSSAAWAAQNDHGVTVIQLGEQINRDLPKFTAGYDWVFIDCPPQMAKLAGKAIRAADVALIPTTPSPYDVWACEDMVDLVKAKMEATSDKFKAAFVITMNIKNTNLSNEIQEALDEFELPAFKSRITRSVIFPELTKDGVGVSSLSKKHPQATEIRQIVEELKELASV